MEIVVFAKSLISVWIVLVSITIQGYRYIIPFDDFLPLDITAKALGFFGATPFTLFIPGIICAALGVIGLPLSWFDGFKELFNAIGDENGADRGFIQSMMRMFNTTMTTLVPLWPFPGEKTASYEPSSSQRFEPAVDDEIWIYINGICTTRDLNKANCVKLNKLFHRKVISVHNPTNSVWYDLLECAMGKVGLFLEAVPPRRELKKVLKESLEKAEETGKKKVVLIAHSQGTIITGRALQEMADREELQGLMKKYLHVYLFANCANKMPVESVAYLENISNSNDVVAWLGEFFPFPNFWVSKDNEPIDPTPTVEIKNRWGHLLNTHYLVPMERNPEMFKESALVKQLMVGKGVSSVKEVVEEPKVMKQE